MAATVTHCGIVILAGGTSSRLGRPKQLLPYRHTTLLGHAIEVALAAGCGPVFVVTGAHPDKLEACLANAPVVSVHNPEWEEGMASSLRTGLAAMKKAHPETDGIIFMVCDQPFVTKSVLLCLMEAQRNTGKSITASLYDGRAGTPALFHQSVFGRLMELKGDKGARVLIAGYPDEVTLIPFEKGITDIDTEKDYEQLIHSRETKK